METPIQSSILANASPTMSTINTNGDFWKAIGIIALFAFMTANAYNIYYTHLQIKEHYKKKKLYNDNNNE